MGGGWLDVVVVVPGSSFLLEDVELLYGGKTCGSPIPSPRPSPPVAAMPGIVRPPEIMEPPIDRPSCVGGWVSDVSPKLRTFAFPIRFLLWNFVCFVCFIHHYHRIVYSMYIQPMGSGERETGRQDDFFDGLPSDAPDSSRFSSVDRSESEPAGLPGFAGIDGDSSTDNGEANEDLLLDEEVDVKLSGETLVRSSLEPSLSMEVKLLLLGRDLPNSQYPRPTTPQHDCEDKNFNMVLAPPIS